MGSFELAGKGNADEIRKTGATSLGRKEKPLFAVHSLETARPLRVAHPRLWHSPWRHRGWTCQRQGSLAKPAFHLAGAPPGCGLHTACWQPLKLHVWWQPPELSTPPPHSTQGSCCDHSGKHQCLGLCPRG